MFLATGCEQGVHKGIDAAEIASAMEAETITKQQRISEVPWRLSIQAWPCAILMRQPTLPRLCICMAQ